MESNNDAGSSSKSKGIQPERCRTCQKRKVRCGQEMPVCFNCERLGLTCERKARYKLKDVTQKTRKSIASTVSERGSIWDANFVRLSRSHTTDTSHSGLEHEAALKKPGTYFIDATPENVLEMYNEDEASDIVSSVGTIMGIPPPPKSVSLNRFEDYGNTSSIGTASRKSQSFLKAALSKNYTKSEYSSATVSTIGNVAKRMKRQALHSRGPNMHLTMFNKALIRSRDLQYYNHYRSVVVYNMQINSRMPTDVKPFCHDENELEDSFETAAASFAPLYHAMMALSALSLAHRERLDRVDALEHYQQAVTGLREYNGTESVNLIYTHYFLLLYEVAACESGQANLEFEQMARLSRLLGWFFTTSQTNPAHAFRDQVCSKCTQICMNCIPGNMLYCDMYNLMLHREVHTIIPDEMIVGFFSVFNQIERDWQIEAAFKDNIEVAYMMVKLNILGGWAHRVVRDIIEDFNRLEPGQLFELDGYLRELERKIQDMDQFCMDNPALPCDTNDIVYQQLPLQIRTLFDSAQYSIRSLRIYARTSISPSQLASLTPATSELITSLAQEILTLTRPRWGVLHPIGASNLMALFICGTVVTSKEDKEEVLAVLRSMGASASGRNFECAIQALQELYQEQERLTQISEGSDRTIDWLTFLREKGLLDFSLFGL